jgi:hypothetical protein
MECNGRPSILAVSIPCEIQLQTIVGDAPLRPACLPAHTCKHRRRSFPLP